VIVNAGRPQQAVYAGMTLIHSRSMSRSGHMKLATLQISLRIDLCHLAAAAMTVSALPGLFLFTVRTIAYLKDLTVFFYKVFFGLPLGLAPSTSQSMHLCVCDAG